MKSRANFRIARRSGRTRLLLLLVLLSAHTSAESITRKLCLNADWQFARLDYTTEATATAKQGADWASQFDVEHVATSGPLAIRPDTLAAEAVRLGRSHWQEVRLPHTPFIEAREFGLAWQGVCYYRRTLTLGKEDEAGQLWLEFEGAMSVADVWIDGRHATQHLGGYNSFVVDATRLLHEGNNELLVRLDNRDNPLVPPGKPQRGLDFCYYGGIYRNVYLICKPNLFVTHPLLSQRPVAGGGIFVTYPEADSLRASVKVLTEVANKRAVSASAMLRQTLKDGRLTVAATELPFVLGADSCRSIEQTLSLTHPHLWSTDDPHRYTLITEIADNGTTIDRETTRIGIRRFEMTARDGFRLNGKSIRLVGTNRHQEYPYIGYALSDEAQRRDVWQMKESGFNIVRLCHYPQSPALLNACDELGLLAIEPIPGWQFYNKDTTFVNLTLSDTRTMIRRDRNHPSIVMWETLLNESWPPNAWKDAAIAAAHQEMPGDQCFTSGDTYGYFGFDVAYNDWDDAGFSRPAASPKPNFIREYYDYEFGGQWSTTRIHRGDGERALQQNAWNAQWEHNLNASLWPHTMGDAVWSMYDYNRGCETNDCRSGVADAFRLPKWSLHFFRSQMKAGTPLPSGQMPHEVFIAGYWREGSPDTLLVYGNVDEVELRLNGKFLARRKADSGKDTKYVSRPDGGNSLHLNFAPFTFARLPWQAGQLEAIGYAAGKKVAEQTIRTPEEPQRLSICYFEQGTPASQDDNLIVYVNVEDKYGTICPLNGQRVELKVEGGEIQGPSTFDAEAGVASFIVRTASKAKSLIIRAQSGTLKAERVIKLRPSTQQYYN